MTSDIAPECTKAAQIVRPDNTREKGCVSSTSGGRYSVTYCRNCPHGDSK